MSDSKLDYGTDIQELRQLIEATFPPEITKVMQDYHKSSDTYLNINYEHFTGNWVISQPGYLREVEVKAGSFVEAVKKFLSEIAEANKQLLIRHMEEQVNDQIPKEFIFHLTENYRSIRICHEETLETFDYVTSMGNYIEETVEEHLMWAREQIERFRQPNVY